MDEFLKEIHTQFFKKWICMQVDERYKVYIDDKYQDVIYIKTKYGQGEITFNPLNIIELKVTNKITEEVDFYLHFQMETIKHAVELFSEMIESIINLSNRLITKVLLSCSGGLTTGFFAQRINEVVQLLGLDLKVDAIGYNQLFQVANNYDIILLAPQISYLHAKIHDILKDQIIINIPPQIFAKYDVGKILSLITEASEHKNKIENIDANKELFHLDINDTRKIFCLTIFKNKTHVHISYRLFQKGKIILDNEIIKSNISIQDIYDVLDTVILQYPDVTMIGIAIPGIIHNGLLSSSYIKDIENNEIEKAFTNRYTQKILISNDVNAAAVGYYVSQEKYHTFMFLFQPISLGAGSGIIIDGKLMSGSHNFAGEVLYLPLNLSQDKSELNCTPEGTLELVCKTALSSMCIIDPQAIILFSDLITNVEELRSEIEKIVPQTFIPEIIKVDNVLEYILLGQMVLCTQWKGEILNVL